MCILFYIFRDDQNFLTKFRQIDKCQVKLLNIDIEKSLFEKDRSKTLLIMNV